MAVSVLCTDTSTAARNLYSQPWACMRDMGSFHCVWNPHCRGLLLSYAYRCGVDLLTI